MKVVFLTGPQGAETSEKMYDRIINESLKNPEKRLFLVVPEQSTMQAQRSIVTRHPNGGTFNIDIVSFNRLAYRIFEELGVSLPGIIDDTGKNLILRKVIEEKKSELKLIKPKSTQGFVSEIKSVISELLQYSVSLDMLSTVLDRLKDTPSLNNNTRLRMKLNDICIIYRGFLEYINERYITTEQITDILIKHVPSSLILNDSIIAFDGFTGFTPSQYKLIELLFDKAEEMYFTAIINREYDDEIVFSMSRDMMSRIGKLADLNNVHTKEEYFASETDYYENPALLHLEQNIFRADAAFEEKTDRISVFSGMGVNKEVQYVAATIKKLVAQENIRYREIGVITSNPDGYREVLKETFENYDIPLFLDNKRSVITNPMVEYIRAAINVIVKDYSYEAMFRFLKSSMCSIDRSDVDLMENYCLALGIRGHNKWASAMQRKYPGKRELSYARINEIRANCMEFLEPLYQVLKDSESTVSDYVECLNAFIQKSEVELKLEKLSEACLDDSDFSRAKEYKVTYTKITELFTQLDSLLGKEKVNVKEFCDILDAGFMEIKLGIIPPTIDMVMAGDVERTRLSGVKAVFFLGCDEGLVPKGNVSTGLFSEYEREEMLACDFEISPTVRQKAYMQNFYLYLLLTKPTYKLFITTNRENNPSKLIEEIKSMFPNMVITDDDHIDSTYLINDRHDAQKFILENIDSEGAVPVIHALLSEEKMSDDFEKLLDKVTMEVADEDIVKETLRQLYGDTLNISVSKVESFASCPFRFFSEYGLALEERKLYEIGAADLGTIFHDSLEIYSNALCERKLDFATVPDEIRESLVLEAVDKAMCDIHESVFGDSKRNEHMRGRIEKMMLTTSFALGKQLKAGQFVASDFEKKFVYNEDGMRISGKIDRIDYAHYEDKTFVKVIDYKSGNVTLDYGRVYDGLNLQLLVYLNSLIKDKLPSAALYYHISDPIVDEEGGIGAQDDSESEYSILEKLKPNGAVNVEIDSLSCLVGNAEEEKEYVIPVSYDKDNNPKQSKNTFTEYELRTMSEYAALKMTDLGREISSGKVAATPFADSCEYCKYKNVCRFDIEKKGNHYRRHTKFVKTETKSERAVMMEKFSERVNKNGQGMD